MFMFTLIRPALVLFFILSIITGFIYPLTVLGLGQLLFPVQTMGSLIRQGDKTLGSTLIGQAFTQPQYFWSRPSATASPYDAAASGGSNLAPSNPALLQAVQQRIATLQALDPSNRAPIPIDLVTTSASGLDPHISVAAAHYQIDRVARLRQLNPAQVLKLVNKHTELPIWALLGEARVNVLQLNLDLDRLSYVTS